MLDLVEIRNLDGDLLMILDTAESVIWHSVYFGVGDFEISAEVTAETLRFLKPEILVARPDHDEAGIIERVEITREENGRKMILASGRFLKSILARRLIYNLFGIQNTPTILRGNVETAVREVVKNNAIACPFDSSRNIPPLELGALANAKKTILSDSGKAAQRQVSHDNLMEYTDALLEEYGMGARVILAGGNYLYQIFEGRDRSVGNAEGLPSVVFSPDYDNLTESNYLTDTSTERNIALVGGEGEGAARHHTTTGGKISGLDRREIWVDASSVNKTYKDANDEEHEYSLNDYREMLIGAGLETLAENNITSEASGTIDITNGSYRYGRDFSLGDIVTIQDNAVGLYADARIVEILEAKDENGYTATAVYK